MKQKTILVLCTGNSCRSQIAEAYLRYFSHGKIKVYSAGIETHGLNPNAVLTMKEDGIDISNHTSHHINEYKDIQFDYVLTVCDHAQENCPFFPTNAISLHQNFLDPAKLKGTDPEIKLAFRKVREQIKKHCIALINNVL